MKVATVVTTGLLALAAATVAGSQDSDHLSPAEVDERLQNPRREERLFAFFTTTSVKILATTTITAISTCLSVTASPTCTGRRKRSLQQKFSHWDNLEMDPNTELLGSITEEVVENSSSSRVAREVVNNREGKRLTVWSTLSSTLTITSTSYLTGTTVTASALCVAPGVTAGCFG